MMSQAHRSPNSAEERGEKGDANTPKRRGEKKKGFAKPGRKDSETGPRGSPPLQPREQQEITWTKDGEYGRKRKRGMEKGDGSKLSPESAANEIDSKTGHGGRERMSGNVTWLDDRDNCLVMKEQVE